MPKPLTLLLAGVIGALLAVLAMAAVTPLLTTTVQSAANQQDGTVAPEVYGDR